MQRIYRHHPLKAIEESLQPVCTIPEAGESIPWHPSKDLIALFYQGWKIGFEEAAMTRFLAMFWCELLLQCIT